MGIRWHDTNSIRYDDTVRYNTIRYDTMNGSRGKRRKEEKVWRMNLGTQAAHRLSLATAATACPILHVQTHVVICSSGGKKGG